MSLYTLFKHIYKFMFSSGITNVKKNTLQQQKLVIKLSADSEFLEQPSAGKLKAKMVER